MPNRLLKPSLNSRNIQLSIPQVHNKEITATRNQEITDIRSLAIMGTRNPATMVTHNLDIPKYLDSRASALRPVRGEEEVIRAKDVVTKLNFFSF